MTRFHLTVLGAVVVVQFFLTTAIIPLYPELANLWGVPASRLGIAEVAFAVASLLFLPIFGRLSDRVGRFKILSYTLAIDVVGSVIVALAPSFPIFLLGRTLQGVGSAILPLVTSSIYEGFDGNRRRRAMALVMVMVTLGASSGPLVSSALGVALAPLLWTTVASLCAIGAAATTLFPAPFQARTAPTRFLMRLPFPTTLLVLVFIFVGSSYQLFRLLVPFRLAPLDEPAWVSGALIAMVSLGACVVQIILSIAHKYWQRYELLFALSIGGMMVAVFLGTVPDLLILSIGALLLGLSSGLTDPIGHLLLLETAPAASRGQMVGSALALSSLARVIGPATSAWFVQDHVTGGYIFGSILATSAFVIALLFFISHHRFPKEA